MGLGMDMQPTDDSISTIKDTGTRTQHQLQLYPQWNEAWLPIRTTRIILQLNEALFVLTATHDPHSTLNNRKLSLCDLALGFAGVRSNFK